MAVLMTILKVLGIILLCVLGLLLLVLLILLFTRAEVIFRFDEDGAVLKAGAWGYKYSILPRKKKKPKEKPKPQQKPPEEEKPEEKKEKKGGDVRRYLKYLSPALDALKGSINSIFLKRIEVCFTAAKEDDPAGTAMMYGSAWAAAGTLIPLLENNANVKKYRFRIDADFDGTKPLLSVYLHLVAPLWRFFAVGLRFGWKALIITIKSKLEEKRNRS